MSGVWRKGVCDRCGRVGYVHVAVNECSECVHTRKELSPPELSIKAMEDRKVKMHVHVSKGCCQWPPAGVDPRKTPCPCPCHNEDA